MNAGAEYVVYRLLATLRDADGIHPESLVTCLGALAGYACQASVRQQVAMGDGQPAKHFQVYALDRALAGNPLSVWALVGRTVQKLGQPLPNLDEIAGHVTKTLGTDAFGVLRVPEEHRPRHAAIVYLRQLWPQILPIAQRFCRRPAQLSVLFGIALQRAIELTHHRLSPTLAATIAMESAVAMSKVTLAPEVPPEPAQIAPPPPAARAASPRARAAHATRAATSKVFDGIRLKWPDIGPLSMLSPQARSIATIASLALISFAIVTSRADRTNVPSAAPAPAPATAIEFARAQRQEPPTEFQNTPDVFEPPYPEPQPARIAQTAPASTREDPQLLEESTVLPPPTTPDFNEGIIVEDGQNPIPSSFASSETLPSPDTVEL
jgi:hypothetical protein